MVAMGRVYDDAREHREQLPGDLPRKAGATHIGMFFAWCAMRGHASEWHGRYDPARLERLTARELTGRDYVVDYLDGQLTDEHLTPEGQAFAEAYLASGEYVTDYAAVLAAGQPSRYHVEDTWDAFDALVPVLDAAWSAHAAKAGVAEPEPVVVVPDPVPEVEIERVYEPEPEPEPVAEPEPMRTPVREPMPDPLLEPPPEPLEFGIPMREQETIAPYEAVLRTGGGMQGGPVIVSEPDDGSPLPAESDGDEAWTWEQTVRRDTSEPPALPPADSPLRKRLAIKVGRGKGKSGGWVWVGLVIFLLLYGCGKAMSQTKTYFEEPMIIVPEFAPGGPIDHELPR